MAIARNLLAAIALGATALTVVPTAGRAASTVDSALGIIDQIGTTYFSDLGSYSAFLSALSSLSYTTLFDYFSGASVRTVGVESTTDDLWVAKLSFDTVNEIVLSNGVLVNTVDDTVTPIAVPGPIAAAGLPAVLGLMGFGLYRRRQQQAAA